jgi:hypothetical protein
VNEIGGEWKGDDTDFPAMGSDGWIVLVPDTVSG